MKSDITMNELFEEIENKASIIKDDRIRQIMIKNRKYNTYIAICKQSLLVPGVWENMIYLDRRPVWNR